MGMEVGGGAARTLAVGDRDDRDRLPVFHALDRHLGLDPEPVGGEVEPAETTRG